MSNYLPGIVTMALNEETGAALVGRRLEYTAIGTGGERWARDWFPKDWATHICGATISDYFPGVTTGRDKFEIKWDHGELDRWKLSGFIESLVAKEGTALLPG